MKIKEFINEDKIYTQVEEEIREWVEKSYPGLSIEFYPHLEIVRTNPEIDFAKERVPKITEAVNIKIGDILEAHDEEIYIAGKLTKIWQKHPRFNIEVESIEDIKRNPKFLKYFKELTIKKKQKEITHGKQQR